jgi:phage terminase Nu1 subunit (DNA packaging protein)
MMAMTVLSDANAFCSARQLSEILGISQRQIERLTASRVLEVTRGKLRHRYQLATAVKSYLAYQKQYVTEQAKGADDAGYMRARARRMAALAQQAEFELEIQKGKMYYAVDVEHALTTMITACKARLLAMPSRVMHQLVGRTDPRETNKIVGDEIYSALTELSEGKWRNSVNFRREQERYLKSLDVTEEMVNGEKPSAVAG